MNWSSLIVLSSMLAAGGSELEFASYTDAWHKAAEVKRPMLVILNPATEGASRLTLEQLRENPEVAPLLDKYVVAVVDTSTEHGQQVHKLFGEQSLPFVSIIDENQKKQVYQGSILQVETLKPALTKYQDGAASVVEPVVTYSIMPQGDCPNCRKNLQFAF